jgi:putative endonuclease
MGAFVYILTNIHHTVLYVGVTSNLPARIEQHLIKAFPSSFTAKYNVCKLVYYCSYHSIDDAIAEEKRIKGGSRIRKVQLIESVNKNWDDLWMKEVSKW